QIDRIKTRGTMIKERDNLKTILQADEFDEAKAREAFQKMSSIRENMFISKTKMMNEMKKILTPDQIKMLDERKAGRSGWLKGKRRMDQREAPGCFDQSNFTGYVDQNKLTVNECSKDCSRW
ncbi:MAG: Spy/CpxP family protein refolding chaperone, partial [Deltaproteobacteria bacterium]|nr:Spy/CpxP family protein refolding chaperone [Deltaproteobacteria bacterium]